MGKGRRDVGPRAPAAARVALALAGAAARLMCWRCTTR